MRRRSLGLVLAAIVLTAVVSLGKVKSAAARVPRAKTKRTLIHRPVVVGPIAHRAVTLARKMVGTPYRWGGTSPASGFDCSGLVYFVYSRLGIHLPRSSYDQVRVGRSVQRGRLRPGDLLFFSGSSHVGIYLGAGRFVHAPHSGARVAVDSLGGWGGVYDGARRVIRDARALGARAAG